MVPRIKECIVVGCENTSATTPEKIFLCVPRKRERRARWFQAINYTGTKTCHSLHVCEDHFDVLKLYQLLYIH